jgi:hypothetical protein
MAKLDPSSIFFGKCNSRRWMDARVKPAHDEDIAAQATS